MIGLIHARDLDAWSSRIVAPPEFPRLVRRLIHATGRALRSADFPADEATRLPGWDGTVIADEAAPNVPSGRSAWELGTDRDIRRKANDEYTKRTKNPISVDPSEATFVFVTPRSWPGKYKWAESKRKEAKWMEVVALDAEDLAQWIESAPAVAAWLGPTIGVLPPEATGVEVECETYRRGTSPPFTLAGLLIGREPQRGRLIEFLAGAPGVLQISCTTELEGTAFVGACIECLSEEERESVLARTVVVHSTAALRHLTVSPKPLVVITSCDVSGLNGTHHHIVVKTSRGSSVDPIELGAQPVTPLIDYLNGLGVDRNLAYQRCMDAAGYLERVRQTMLVIEPSPPPWSLPPVSTATAAAILIGEWDEARSEDQAIVAAIAGVDYEVFVRALTPYVDGPHPLIGRAATVWKVYARPTAWRILEGALTSRQISAFVDAAVAVIPEDDPRFELAPGERWMASGHGKRRAHSEQLRHGLATGLVHVAVLGRDCSSCYAGQRGQSWVDEACRRLFAKRQEKNFWHRIRDELRELAEASPDSFLSALEADLDEDEPQVMDLFEQEGEFGGFPQSRLLWALELLAWSPDYVGRTALLLAALTERDPGGRNGNRPARSLAEIVHPAFQNCGLNTQERIALFVTVTRRHPKVGWALGTSLMPAVTMISEPTQRPELRDWAPLKPEEPVAPADYWSAVQAIVERLLEMAGHDVDRWVFLLSHLKSFQQSLMERVLAGAEGVAKTLDQQDRLIFWQRLRTLLHRHNQFRKEKEVSWVYSHAMLDRLKLLYDSLTPDDLIDRLSWLFSGHVALPDIASMDYMEQQAQVSAAQDAAVDELSALEFDQIVAALPRFASRRQLGYCLGRCSRAPSLESALLRRCSIASDPREQEFARGFAVARYQVSEQDFLRRWFRPPSADFLSQRGVAIIAQALGPITQIWDAVEAAGPECGEAYWRETPAAFLKDPHRAERAARNLVGVGRALDALCLLSMNASAAYLAGSNADLQLVLNILYAAIGDINANEARAEDSAYHVASLIKALVESQRLSPSEIVRLEWSYFGALQYNAQHKLLIYQRLISEPELLLQIVSLIYFPEGTDNDSRPELTDSQKALASQAWRIFHEWAPFQGLAPEAMPSSAEILKQVDDIRARAADRRHVQVVDDLLGKALASSPVGMDGVWPHESIREVLERFGTNEEISEGFVVGKVRLLGVTSRLPGDGGAQERDHAQQYAKWQRQLALSNPKTSRLLGRLAENYRSDATFHDNLGRQR